MSLTNVQYDAIMRAYDRRQARQLREMQRRRELAYQAVPSLAQLDRSVSRERSAMIRSLFSDEAGRSFGEEASGLQEQTASYLKKAQTIEDQRRMLLAQAGFPENYLEPLYECPDCQDTGFIRDPSSPGGIKRCHCFHQAVIDLLYTQSGLREILEAENFSTFSLDYYSKDLIDPSTGKSSRQNMEEILSYCRNALRSFDQSPPNLFFYGDTGLGKTFLTHCIAKELLESSHSVMYYSAFSLFEWLAQITFGRDASEDEKEPGSSIRYLYECDYLIIDDLGTELTNSFVSSRLFTILNERIARKKGTLISTNLSLSAFAQTYSERIFSRITSGYRLLHFFGNDIRIQKKLSRRTTNGTIKSSHQKP